MGAVCLGRMGRSQPDLERVPFPWRCRRRHGVGLYGRISLQRAVAMVGKIVRSCARPHRPRRVVADRLVLGADASRSRSGDRSCADGVRGVAGACRVAAAGDAAMAAGKGRSPRGDRHVKDLVAVRGRGGDRSPDCHRVDRSALSGTMECCGTLSRCGGSAVLAQGWIVHRGKSRGGDCRPVPERPGAVAVIDGQWPGIRIGGFSASSGT